MDNYQQRIKDQFSELSNGMKKVARHLLNSPHSFAMQSASEVGKEIGVSETTVIRLCYALKYSGFSELQKEVRKNLIYSKSSLHTFQEDKEEMRSGPHFYYQSMEKDQQKIQQMMEQLSEVEIHAAVKRLIESKNVLVAGMRTSYAVAYWFSFTLNLIRGNTHLFHSTDDVIEQLLKMNEDSTLFLISFHRYATETINLAKAAKARGSYVIAISDSAVSPIAEYADIHFPIQLPITSTIDVAPAVFSLMNAIIAGVSVHDSERFKKRREAYESLHLDGFFYQGG